MHTRWILKVGVLTSLLLWGVGCGKKEKPERETSRAETAKSALENVSEDVKSETVATIGDLTVSRDLLYRFAQYHPTSPQAPELALKATPSDLEPLIHDLALALQIGKRKGEVFSEDLVREIGNKETVELIKMLYEEDVIPTVKVPTDDEVRKYYEENQEAFTAPLLFSVRHIFVSNYREVLTREGQTLESLAHEISGDVSAVDRILVDNGPKSPRAPGWSTGNRSTIKPLQPGERLLVPVSAEERKANLAKINQARERVEKGEDFEKVAREVSDGASPGQLIPFLGSSGRPILPKIREAVRATEQGKVTEVFETKHGYNIMKVESKSEQPPVPFDQAALQIRQVLSDQKLNEAMDAYATGLYEPPTLQVDYEKFADPDTPDDAVVVKAGDKEFTNKDVQMPLAGAVRKDMPKAQIMRLLRTNARLQNALFEYRAQQKGLDRTPRYRVRLAGVVYGRYLSKYLEALRKEMIRTEIDPEEALRYFETHRESFNLPPNCTYLELAARVSKGEDGKPLADGVEKATARIAGWVAGVNDPAAFQQAVERHSEDPESKARRGLVTNKSVGSLSEGARKALRAIRPGRMSEPYVEDDYVKIAWLQSTRDRRQATLEDTRGNLSELVKAVRLRGYPETFKEDMIQRANVRIGK